MGAKPRRAQKVVSAKLNVEDMSRLRAFERHLGTRVVRGFLVLVPLLVTVWILQVVYRVVDGLFRGEQGLLSFLVRDRPWDFSGIGVILTLVVLYVVGAFFAGKRSQALQDAALTKVPVVKSIYGVVRQATDALSSPDGQHFSRVVFLEWPRPGVRALGFVTGHIHDPGEDRPGTVVVYIPTVPNPTSGMLAWVSESELIETDITVEDAMKVVFSGGIVLPKMPVHATLDVSPRLGHGHDD